jgi:hypothetical protein
MSIHFREGQTDFRDTSSYCIDHVPLALPLHAACDLQRFVKATVSLLVQ